MAEEQQRPKLDLGGLKDVKLAKKAEPTELAKAHDMTQHAINNLGGPIYASGTDHKVGDVALAAALTQKTIQSQGEKSANTAKAPVDRAVAEALTLNAINANAKDKLKGTDKIHADGLNAEQLAALQQAAKEEKDRKEKARTFGGGDSKAGMANILGEITGQGGIIAVPTGKVNENNAQITTMKTHAQINALGEPVFASMTDYKVEDKSLAAAKLQMTINKQGEKAADPSKAPKDRVLAEAHMMQSLSSEKTKASLKESVAPADRALEEARMFSALNSEKTKSKLKEQAKPADGLSPEQLAALVEAAKLEKEAPADAE